MQQIFLDRQENYKYNFAFPFFLYSYEISLTNGVKKSLECKYYVNLLQNLAKREKNQNFLARQPLRGILTKYFDQ